MKDEAIKTAQRWSDRARARLPKLELQDRLELIQRIEAGSKWSVDYLVMMGLATALAALGLLLDATAIVIGAMLVAPLMTPLIGAGLALVQGNVSLFRDALKALAFGTVTGLVVAAAIGLLTPTYEPTLEVEARGEVNILDLVVAFLSGMAAAYAMARPKLVAALAGVAIAAALVPPLAVVGIALAYDRPALCGLAAILFTTNLVAIVLGAALVFRVLGVRGARTGHAGPLWARRTILLLIVATGLLVAPLDLRLIDQVRQGQARPLNYPASTAVRDAVNARLESEPGVSVLQIGRSGVEPETGIGITLVCDHRVPRSLEVELAQLVRETIGRDTTVTVNALLHAWETPDPS